MSAVWQCYSCNLVNNAQRISCQACFVQNPAPNKSAGNDIDRISETYAISNDKCNFNIDNLTFLSEISLDLIDYKTYDMQYWIQLMIKEMNLLIIDHIDPVQSILSEHKINLADKRLQKHLKTLQMAQQKLVRIIANNLEKCYNNKLLISLSIQVNITVCNTIQWFNLLVQKSKNRPINITKLSVTEFMDKCNKSLLRLRRYLDEQNTKTLIINGAIDICMINEDDKAQYTIKMHTVDTINDLQLYIARKRGISDYDCREIALFGIDGQNIASTDDYIANWIELNGYHNKDNDYELILCYNYVIKIILKYFDRMHVLSDKYIPLDIFALIESYGIGYDVETNVNELRYETLNVCYVESLALKKIDIEGNILIDSVYDIKHKIQKKEGIPIAEQKLIFDGIELINSLYLSDYKIRNGSVLCLFLRFH